ncbi:ABC transporter substrate-binding protein [Brevibacterium samyangense]|uniref:Basic amino acid ABC transporter substrate-binding protein n=1 Tax=Brevibacterium samyangense TaxID=366888 RepID=A0ABP5F459_9MICO
MKRSLPLAALLAAGALVLSACGGGSTSTESEASGYVNEGQLTLCSDIPYPPFEYVENGENIGFDIDIATQVAEDLGLELNVITTAFEAIQSGVALDSNQCDLVLSGMAITAERATKMDFSKPYLKDNLALMANSAGGVTDIESAKDKKVGVQQATTGEALAEEHGISPVQFEDVGLLDQAISSGQIDAAIANISTIYSSTQANPDLKLVQDFETGEVIGAAVKMGNTELLESFESTMTELRTSGRYDELVDQWFGTVADNARISDEEIAAFDPSQA